MAAAHAAGSALDHGPYSHGELIFSDRMTGSSWAKGGVAVRQYPEARYRTGAWDFYSLPDNLEPAARKWFVDHAGEKYDMLGPARFAIGIVRQTANRWYCHEATAEALGLPDSWRWTGGMFVALGPILWRGSFRRVPGPWQDPWPSVIVRCSHD